VDIYVQLRPGINVDETSSIIRNAMIAHVSEDKLKQKPEIFLQPMSQWHLYADFENGVPVTSERMKAIGYYGTIGAFVLLLACINFMNLSTARSEKRAKEVGIRKSIGSLRHQLIQQFFGESLLVVFLAFAASVLLVQLSLPWFNEVSDKNISIPWKSLVFWLSGVAFTFFTGALAGSYPAFYLSSFKPVNVLKGTFRAGKAALLPRRVLVTLQFTVSITLTIGTMIVYQQIRFAKDRPVGYSREGLLTVRAASPEYRSKYQVLRSELKKTGVVEEIAEANYPVTDIRGWNGGFSWHNKKIEPSFNTIFVTHEYGKTIGWEFVEGRDFSRKFPTDKNGIIINESALKILGLENPVGESLTWAPQGDDRGTFQILGVVKDMVKGSPFESTFPSIIFLSEGDMPWLFLRLKPATNPHEALPKMQAVFNNLVPSAAFDYTFADEAYDAKFRVEKRINKLATLFSVLAIMISCLGLFGLASFVAEQRTKEIGIRKVLGASMLNLWQMLSKDFMVLVVISIVIAIPLSFSFMNKWLLQYEYRTSISWSVFVISGVGAFAVTVFTVSFQAVKAAWMNPVKSLRSE
jgi:ABC-type antimicrobial peptide transport system permease subunit